MDAASAPGLIHHCGAGNEYTSIAFAETLVLESTAASIGSVGGPYNNTLTESVIRFLKTEAVPKGSPFLSGTMKTIDDVEFATMGWVDWFNQRRLHSTLDYFTPDEFEKVYYSHESALRPTMLQVGGQETRDRSHTDEYGPGYDSKLWLRLHRSAYSWRPPVTCPMNAPS